MDISKAVVKCFSYRNVVYTEMFEAVNSIVFILLFRMSFRMEHHIVKSNLAWITRPICNGGWNGPFCVKSGQICACADVNTPNYFYVLAHAVAIIIWIFMWWFKPTKCLFRRIYFVPTLTHPLVLPARRAFI